jgi:beta-glucosidase
MPETLSYLNPDLPLPERVRDLIGRLTLAEKLSQMTFEAPAIPRLGVPAYNYWGEALHGVARNGRATVFPQAIGMAATWDPDLIRRVASAIGDEGRAKFHALQRRGSPPLTYQSLNFWSPNINIFRDPRWGRGQETWGEDPTFTGRMGGAFVEGLQGDDPHYLKAAACAKHFAVHSGPEKLRHGFDARVSPGELRTTYLPAFKHLVTHSKVEAVMGAYNRTNGEACCASPILLGSFLRQEWGFTGHVVSDCGAIADIYQHHRAAADPAGAAALALKAGCDLECGHTYDHLDEALAQGLIAEADLDLALERSLGSRFKLGLFDPQDRVAYAAIPPEVIGCAEHRQLAYQAAAESVVLLKNRDNILPIRPDIRSICVHGPNAASVDTLLGNYYGLSDHFSTLLEGIAAAVPEGVRLTYHPGCLLDQPTANPLDWAVGEAAASDLTIACLGISRLIEGEEGDALLSTENGPKSSCRPCRPPISSSWWGWERGWCWCWRAAVRSPWARLPTWWRRWCTCGTPARKAGGRLQMSCLER